MPADYTTNNAGESVAYWRALLERERKVWEVREGIRIELRNITSDLDYGVLIDQRPDDGPINQRDYHIIPRYVDRVMATVGDESPEIRFSRNMVALDVEGQSEITMAPFGEAQDRLVTRAMEQAGAPGENMDGAKALCTEGIVAYWYEMTGLPSVTEAAHARKGVGEIMQEAAAGVHEPSRLQDHAEIGGALVSQANSVDPDALREQVAMSEPGTAPFERVGAAGGAHLDAAEAETKMPVFWEQGKYELRCTRLPYGPWFRYDTTVWRHRDRRWYARLVHMDEDVAVKFEGFHPSVRKQLKASALVPDKDAKGNQINGLMPDDTGGDPDAAIAASGKVAMWHILDKKHAREYMIPVEGCEEFLFDRPAPFVDNEGRSYLKPAGSYPGFFPVSVCIPDAPTRIDSQKSIGNPLAMRGLKGQKTVIKMLSAFLKVVEQSSSCYTVMADDLFEEYADEFRMNRGGIIPRGATSTKDNPAIEQVSWKPPSFQLYQQISEEIGRTLDDLNFPETQFTGRPVARTATQEQLANASGTEGLFEQIRHMEVCYAEQAHITLSMIRVEFIDAKLDALIGPLDRQRLQAAWGKIGVPEELPTVKFAANARSRNAERAKLLMDLHERTMADIDPLTGMPKYKTDYSLEEAHVAVGLGKPEKFVLTPEQRQARLQAMAEAQLAEQGGGPSQSGGKPGEAAPGGKTRDSQGKPRGRRENAGRRDSSRGRGRGAPRGSAAKV